MALSEIKTNIQKCEAKDEPQTNDSHKIRQIMSKIMESTHTHTHTDTHERSQNSPTKIQWIDPANKGNQKLYLPVENKTRARCQVGNKTMKTKLTDMLRRKERKKE